MAYFVPRNALRAVAVVLLALFVALPIAAQSPGPTVEPVAPLETAPWPSGDELRRELQDIGFAFRIDRGSGDWLGWAPRATPIEGAAIRLGADGDAPAWTRSVFQTLETDLLGADTDSTLTAFMEVATRTPLPARVLRTTFRFLTEELLVEAPVLLQQCYATATDSGLVVVRLDTETGEASVLLAESAESHPDGEDIVDCTPISVIPDVLDPGTSRSERVTITTRPDGSIDPAEVTVEGGLVTIVLTFRNDSSEERSLSFALPLDADTGPVTPGASTLIVLRRLEPGAYRFSSASGSESSSGVIRVVLPAEE